MPRRPRSRQASAEARKNESPRHIAEPGVKAMGGLAHGRAQLSMNITDLAATPVSSVYAQVCRLASRHKGEPVEAEVIGLLPEIAFEQESEWMRLLSGFNPETKVLERRLDAPLAWPECQGG